MRVARAAATTPSPHRAVRVLSLHTVGASSVVDISNVTRTSYDSSAVTAESAMFAR
jgi:hypothetical protein